MPDVQEEKVTWWLWEATLDRDGRSLGHRIVLEVKTAIMSDGCRVDTPVGYFGECDSGSGVDDWWATRMMIEAEEFARLRASGAIRELPTDVNDKRTNARPIES